MSFSLPSLRSIAIRLLVRPTPLTAAMTTTTSTSRPTPTPCPHQTLPTTRTLSTTTTLTAKGNAPPRGGGKPGTKPGTKPGSKPAKQAKKKAGGKHGLPARDPKFINMLSHFAILSPDRIPAPLRMGRNRHLRHWTIHRAWMLFRRREREARERNLMRQHQSMYAACEALRLTAGPGTRDEGYLYRKAMDKRYVYGLRGIPIDYARPQTETPARVAWNHDWKR
ncbi:hypothetical protein B0J18DRAFT_487734 [Chaetomium sp. MPI-SDFR-AT-0129]|nr:hypothetical protein B0J18DRAFT_487734 [Chaetomium sp. MPI-SDFR-AT-0129]